jgi:hypothetical protein
LPGSVARFSSKKLFLTLLHDIAGECDIIFLRIGVEHGRLFPMKEVLKVSPTNATPFDFMLWISVVVERQCIVESIRTLAGVEIRQ